MSKGFLAVILLLVLMSTVASAATIRVPADQPTIQAAINAAVDGDTVQVSKGTYNEAITFNGKAITVRSTYQTDPTAIAGTVITGNGASRVSFNGEGPNSKLRGFTITDCYGGTPSGANYKGAGIYMLNASPIISDSIIAYNRAKAGYGMYGESGVGGGVYCSGGSPSLINVTIENNTTEHSVQIPTSTLGGGLMAWASNVQLTNVVFDDNTADYGGGAYFAGGTDTHVNLQGCTFKDNTAWITGGGAYVNQVSAKIYNGLVINNEAVTAGGIAMVSAPDSMVLNSTFYGNIADRGGAMWITLVDGSPAISNCIVANNVANDATGTAGGIHYAAPSTATVTYCDFYNNTGGSGNYYNCPDQTGINGNISALPQFNNPAAEDFHVKSTEGRWNPVTKTWVLDAVYSPCIDAGSPTSLWGNEPAPNGSRCNQGFDANTPFASKSQIKGLLSISTACAVQAKGNVQITVGLSSAGKISGNISNIAGRTVATLPQIDGQRGMNTLLWSGKSSQGTKVPPGRYMAKIVANSEDGQRSQALVPLFVK